MIGKEKEVSIQYGEFQPFKLIISQEHGNSIPEDRPGYYIYIRDNDRNDYFSISWQPVGKKDRKSVV